MRPTRRAFTADGTKLFYASASTDLGWLDRNHGMDIFLRDLTTGTTTLVTGNAAGTATSNGSSTLSGVSPDGTTVAFGSTANDLGPVDTNTGNPEDIYLRDLVTGATTLVSANATGTDGTGYAYNGRMSADGTKVVWEYLGSAVYVYELASGATTLVTVSADGTGGANGSVGGSSLSSDGTKVGFATTASNLGPHDSNGIFDIYVRDLDTQTTTLVSATADGADGGNAPSFGYGLSPDGSQVLFGSLASDLGPVDTNGMRDVYVRDLDTETTTLVSVNGDGADSGNESSILATLSADGTRVAFQSTANDLGDNDTVMCRRPAGPPGSYYDESCTDIYVRDLVRGTTTLVSARTDGRDGGNSDSTWPAFGPVGHQLVFQSRASDLVGVDTNELWDYFLATPRP